MDTGVNMMAKSPAHIGTYKIPTVPTLAFSVINTPGISTQRKIKPREVFRSGIQSFFPKFNNYLRSNWYNVSLAPLRQAFCMENTRSISSSQLLVKCQPASLTETEKL